MTWHADHDTLTRYVDGRIDEAGAFSVEAHLLSCPSCRASLGDAVDGRRLDRMWGEVLDEVDRPRGGFLEPLLVRLGLPDHVARLLVATPALRLPWVLTVAAVLGFAVLAARAGGGGLLPFLVAAPVVPVIGVALAYGRDTDPIYEIGLASPVGGFRLLLIRTIAVVLASVGVAAVAALGLPNLGWTSAGWLLPSLSLTALTLALSTGTVTSLGAATTVTALWVGGVVVTERLASQPNAAFGLQAHVVLAAIAIVAGLVLVARRDAFETSGPTRPSTVEGTS